MAIGLRAPIRVGSEALGSRPLSASGKNVFPKDDMDSCPERRGRLKNRAEWTRERKRQFNQEQKAKLKKENAKRAKKKGT